MEAKIKNFLGRPLMTIDGDSYTIGEVLAMAAASLALLLVVGVVGAIER